MRPDADLTGVRLVGTPLLSDGDRVKTMGFEGMWIHGPLKLQSEYMKSELGREAIAPVTVDPPNFDYSSWYVSGLWNITGENFGYKGGVPTTPLPNNPGSGMWQVGIRYDHVDLNDGELLTPTTMTGILGGKEDNWTIGVNYYWRSNFKFALNYVKVNSEKYYTKTSGTFSQDPAWNNRVVNDYLSDDPSIIEFRAQIYW